MKTILKIRMFIGGCFHVIGIIIALGFKDSVSYFKIHDSLMNAYFKEMDEFKRKG